eukprot:138742_1
MATSQPSLLDPDKLGLLIQCRQKMDKLNSKQLQDYAQSVLALLSDTQLKKLLFVGCNSIKNHIEYHQLFAMKSSINQTIEEMNKDKRLKHKQKANDTHKSPIATIPKNASLTKHIPSDIISNNICHFLKMSSITQLARCDRQLAVICHTPTSICNLMHRHDPYRYNPRERSDGLIDGEYYNSKQWNPWPHRFKNVEQLAISLLFFDNNASNFATMFTHLKHLSLFDMHQTGLDRVSPYGDPQAPLSLESICFVNTCEFPTLLYIMRLLATAQTHQLKSISFIDCNLWCLEEYAFDEGEYDDVCSEYKNMVNFILPTEPNNLEIIRFENSSFERSMGKGCESANDQFVNLDRIQSSLCNLKGFVYSQRINEPNSENQFFHLSTHISNNISSFKRLSSIHIHCLDDPQLITSFLNRNNMDTFNQITELCISVPIPSPGSPLHYLSTFKTELEKLCVVMHISDIDASNMATWGQRIASIIHKQTKLKVFQVVIIMDETEDETDETDLHFCTKRIVILNKLLKQLVKSLNALERSGDENSQPLVFQLHVKSCHNARKPRCRTDRSATLSDMEIFSNVLQTLLVNYLMAYPFGKIQVKLSWNTHAQYTSHDLLRHRSYFEKLKRMIRIDIKEGGTTKEDKDLAFYTDMDFKQYAICASNKDIEDTRYHKNKWTVDCRYCCNTPWV